MHFELKKPKSLEVKDKKKDTRNQHKTGESCDINISPKSSKMRPIRKKQEYFKIIKQVVRQEDITIMNAYTLKSRATKYLNSKLKGEIYKSELVGVFTISLYIIDRTSRQNR